VPPGHFHVLCARCGKHAVVTEDTHEWLCSACEPQWYPRARRREEEPDVSETSMAASSAQRASGRRAHGRRRIDSAGRAHRARRRWRARAVVSGAAGTERSGTTPTARLFARGAGRCPAQALDEQGLSIPLPHGGGEAAAPVGLDEGAGGPVPALRGDDFASRSAAAPGELLRRTRSAPPLEVGGVARGHRDGSSRTLPPPLGSTGSRALAHPRPPRGRAATRA
jgi:ribosomal protein L37E